VVVFNGLLSGSLRLLSAGAGACDVIVNITMNLMGHELVMLYLHQLSRHILTNLILHCLGRLCRLVGLIVKALVSN